MRELATVHGSRRDGWAVVELAGEIDLSNVAEVDRHLRSWIEPDDIGAVVVLDGVRYLDSAGIRLLSTLADALAARRQSLRLVAAESVGLRSLLRRAGVSGELPLHACVADALAGSPAGPGAAP